MNTDRIPLAAPAPGATLSLTVHRFGVAGARPRIYLQAALHAGEIPGMLVAQHLRESLTELEHSGKLAGEIILVPSANPIGLMQKVLGQPIGRFNLQDGVNYNRGYPHLVPKVATRIEGRLTGDGATNVRVIREALQAELSGWETNNPADVLKKVLLELAIEADVVLDLHCDSEAVMHLYTHTRSADHFLPLVALLQAQALLVAEESGGDPFDEACSRPWAELAGRFSKHPIPFGCHSCTVELRGEIDVNHELAETDAVALIQYLTVCGAIVGPARPVPPAPCRPTPLAGSEQVNSPASGIIVFKAQVGDQLKKGDLVAELIDPLSGASTAAPSPTDGVMFARAAVRFAIKGQTLAKVAGTDARRTGKLLTA